MAPPPLTGLRIVEMAGIGPRPVLRHDARRPWRGGDPYRSRPPAGVQRSDQGPAAALASLHRDRPQDSAGASPRSAVSSRSADGLIEGYRPGVMERLGLGPDVLLNDNPRLVYGRMTGWGQTGPLAADPGHDIDYIAISGALHAFGRAGDKPTAPINMVGDFGGGGMMLAFGMLAALLHAQRSGEGQVVDAAMTDGSALLMSMIWGFRGMGRWSDTRGTNLLDGGAPFYDTYETQDGNWIAVGADRASLLRRAAAGFSASAIRCGTASSIPPRGRRCATVWRPSSGPSRAMPGSQRLRAARRAWPLSSTSTKPPPIRIMSRGGRWSRRAAWSSPPPPRATRQAPLCPPRWRASGTDAATLADLGFTPAEIASLGL